MHFLYFISNLPLAENHHGNLLLNVELLVSCKFSGLFSKYLNINSMPTKSKCYTSEWYTSYVLISMLAEIILSQYLIPWYQFLSYYYCI